MAIAKLRSKVLFPSREARVAMIRLHRHTPVRQHRHDFCEVVLVSGGTGIHYCGSFRQELARGDVIVITGERAHGYERTQGLSLVNILIRYELLRRISRELGGHPAYHILFGKAAKRRQFMGHMRLSPAEYLQIEEWVDHLEAEMSQTDPANRFVAEAYLSLILGALCRYHGNDQAAQASSTSKFNIALNTIEKEFNKPLNTTDLARLSGMSERSLLRKFQSHIGISPAKYLLKIRIQHACQRLMYGDPSRHINEIAQDCGFEDSNYFSRVFRQTINMSPREYRRKNMASVAAHSAPDAIL